MRKIIAAINITIDGFCDHTAGIPDAEIHQHYTDLLNRGAAILYGRKTFELMKYWNTFLTHPSEDESMNDFAHAIDGIPKIVFSRAIRSLEWKTAALSAQSLEEEVMDLKKKSGRDVLVGSPSLIAELTNLNLIDEFQLCIHPVILGVGLPLFKNVKDSLVLKHVRTKVFRGGAVLQCYQPSIET